jgi:hypothetical protein
MGPTMRQHRRPEDFSDHYRMNRSHPMIELNQVETTKPARTRAPKRASDTAPKNAAGQVAKSKDASKVKVSLYLDVEVAQKLTVSSVLRRSDASDVANEILSGALSSVTFYDRSTRTRGETLTSGEIGTEAAA